MVKLYKFNGYQLINRLLNNLFVFLKAIHKPSFAYIYIYLNIIFNLVFISYIFNKGNKSSQK